MTRTVDIMVLVKEPGKKPERRTVANHHQAFHDIVGGWFEILSPNGQVAIVCHDEGKLLSLPHNFMLQHQERGYMDQIVGTVVFTGLRGPENTSLSPEWCKALARMLGRGIVVL